MNIKDAIRTLLFKDKEQKISHQLTTRWGEELNPEQVLTEYPRPQLRRSDYTILNGYWNYEITSEDKKPERIGKRILVPFSPESVLSGVNRQLRPEEFLWYEREFYMEADPVNTSCENIDYKNNPPEKNSSEKNTPQRIKSQKSCILHFGAVDQSCEVYVNDIRVAEHTGGYLPFSVDITKEINPGSNRLLLKVTDASNTSYHSRGKQRLVNGGMWYTAQSGIWQTVWYEWVPKQYITSIKITPNLKKEEITLKISMNHRNEEGNSLFQVVVKEDGKVKKSLSTGQSEFTLKLADVIPWSPEQPFLYDLEISTGEDRIESYFAMRSFELHKDSDGKQRIFLNGKPYFQNGLLDQGYWPDGLYTAPSDEAMIYDIGKAKQLGYNMLRKHIKIEPLRWYYHCDRLGMIVWQDMVNGGEEYSMLLVSYLPTVIPWLASKIKDKHYGIFGRAEENSRREWSIECRDTVELLYNSPCIACWVPFNEGWGQFDAKKAYDLIRERDATRLIDHASGWYDQGIGDFESIHNYFHPLRAKQKKRAVIFSEIGGYACYIKDHSYSSKVYGYKIFASKEELNAAYQKLFREELEVLREKGLSAVVYTQLTDVEEEVNGLLTYDRKMTKVSPLEWKP